MAPGYWEISFIFLVYFYFKVKLEVKNILNSVTTLKINCKVILNVYFNGKFFDDDKKF